MQSTSLELVTALVASLAQMLLRGYVYGIVEPGFECTKGMAVVKVRKMCFIALSKYEGSYDKVASTLRDV